LLKPVERAKPKYVEEEKFTIEDLGDVRDDLSKSSATDDNSKSYINNNNNNENNEYGTEGDAE
jgi:hypothetical protein